MKRAALLACVAVLAPAAAARAACSPTAPPDPAIPTWQAVNGFALGSREATGTEVQAYLTAVDRVSGRVRTAVAGRSLEGRALPYAIVGAPAAIAPGRLARLAARLRAVRAGTGRLPAGAPAFAWVAGSVHGDEPTGADADMQLLYELAAGRDCATLRRLRRLVTFLLPIQNPDGRAADSRFSAAGFDLNRDWFARTQPETRAKLALLLRYPPLVFADQHEEDGNTFFFPPNSDPVHHEVPAEALNAISRVYGPALRAAFQGRGLPHSSSQTFDLFFPGYGDTVPTLLFGAAGMTFESGDAISYAERVDHQHLAAATMLASAADHEPGLLRAWARQWRTARAQGRQGRLQPNHTIVAGDSVRFAVPNRRVYGYALRADAHTADTEALVQRLVTVGVRVERLRSPLTTRALRPFGEAAAAVATLPAGTYLVPMAQTAKHWVQAMLGDDGYVPIPHSYDVSAWSNPLLMGLDGGALEAPLGGRSADRVKAGARVAEPRDAAAAWTWPAGAEGSAELAFALLRSGVAVARRPADGAFVTGGGDVAAMAARAADHGVRLAALDAAPADTVALRLPQVAMLGGGGGLSVSWARYVLERRLGLAVTALDGADITAGRLTSGGFGALVVPDGVGARDQLTPAAAAALATWVRAGGTLVAWRKQGLDVARAAGVTAVAQRAAPGDFQAGGVLVRTTLDPSDPVAWGEDAEGFAFDVNDPILDAHGAPVVARYPAAARAWISGYTVGASALADSAAATDERVGAGRVVLFAFDPAFRGYAEGTERLLANALLAPASG